MVITRPPRLPQPPRGVGVAIEARSGVRWADLLGAPAPTRAECEALDELAQTRSVAPGQTVFTHGETSRSLVVLISADVAMGLATPGGAMRTERLVRGTAWLDASSAWLAGTHVLDAVALTQVQVAELPRAPLQSLLEQRPTLARRLLVSLAGEVRRLTVHAHELLHKDAPARLATWLHAHCQPGITMRSNSSPSLALPNEAVTKKAKRMDFMIRRFGVESDGFVTDIHRHPVV